MKNIFLFSILMYIPVIAQKKVDLRVHNAQVYTVNKKFEKVEAFAVSQGKIIAVGKSEKILKKYTANQVVDAKQNTVFPGFIDAHAHFYGYGNGLQLANLRNTKSWDEILEILQEFQQTHPEGWLLGRGWDQNDWDVKDFPTKEQLDKLFPNRPVYLTRIDGHAAVVNQKVLDLASLDEQTKINGGELIQNNGKLTGVLIDNAMEKIAAIIPHPNDIQVHNIFLEAQQNCFAVGLTSVVDAGLDYDLIEKIESMHNSGELKMRLNVMVSDSDKNLDYLIKRGRIKTNRLQVNGVKIYADGALGSRGAFLLEDYHDQKGHRGLMLSDLEHFKKRAQTIYKHGFQMNTHAIGDGANRILLQVYADVLKGKNDRRWRIEHAQVVSPDDFYFFGKYNIVPSVQPTHATSDMYWAGDRLGEERLKSAYAYKQLLDQNNWIPLGTDFPIEEINPILTFYAAVARKDAYGFPDTGFQKENALTREQALKGMTIWAAKGSFEENEKGSIEVGKFADFVILNQDIMQVKEDGILQTKVLSTFLNGEKVYEINDEP